MKKNLFIYLPLLLLSINLQAECAGWSVALKQQSMSLCAPQTINLQMTVTNGTATLDSCKYNWYIKNPSADDYELLTHVTADITDSFDEVGTYSIYAAAKPNECDEFHKSDTISIELYSATQAGTIIGEQTICYNTTPSEIKESIAPQGGDGIFSRQWQQSADGTTWNNVPGANEATLPASPLTATTKYRLLYTNSCTSVFSNEITVSVRPLITTPIIKTSKSILCFNQETATLTCTTPATSSLDDSVTYQWQESSDGIQYKDIVGAAELSFTTPFLTEDKYYRIVATSINGCGSKESEPINVSVYPDLIISNTGTSPLCYKGDDIISVSASGAGGNYIYQWQESMDKEIWTDIPSATDSSYPISNKGAGTYYYRAMVAPTTGCSSKFSEPFAVVVYKDLSANTIMGIDTVCYKNAPSPLSQSVAPTGGDGAFTYQWQMRTTAAWSDIPGATDTTYQPDTLTATTYYRLQAFSSCGMVTSNEIEIYVRKDLTAPIITSSEETVCYGFAPEEITITTLATCDTRDSLTYQWQERISSDWQNISGATSLTYQPQPIKESHQYRVIATSVKGCGQRISNVRTVNVYSDLQIITNGTSPLCYKTRGTISVTATGEGDSYTYQWQDSTDGIWANLVNGSMQSYTTTPKEQGTYYYRCIVIPTLGCTPDTSAIIPIVVYDDIASGSIAPMGSDTICYGFVPDAISVSIPATGGDGMFSYQWMRRQEGATNFSYIQGATSTTYSPSALYKTTEYQLEVTNACDVIYTNIVKIYVRDELKAPVLTELPDTICYNTIPEPIVVETLPIGGVDDDFTYQWEVSNNGIDYTDITGEISTVYQPNALLETAYYRLRATSVKQCGEVISNTVKVNVYDSLHIDAVSPDTLCYMNTTILSISAVGGGNDFSYQWQDSLNGEWTHIPAAQSQSYETEPKPIGTYYYRCIVSSNKCNVYSRISPVIKVSVYEPLNAGTITINEDSTCYGDAPTEPLHVDIPATGVDGIYTYQWQIEENGVWNNVEGETNTIYQPKSLYKTTNYRLRVETKCDTLYTNSVRVCVNPLPEIQTLSGADNVCYNQHEIYSVEQLNSGYTYEWMIGNGNGELTTDVINSTTIDILWKNPNTTDSVILRVTNDITGCKRDLKFGVTICNEQAPERTLIVRKPNSNILVCEDTELVYQWGYTEKSSLKEFLIDDSNRRYVLLPHTFDSNIYDYWLTLRHSTTSPCYSKSYYSPENDNVITPTEVNVSVPSFVRAAIPIVIQNPDVRQITCSLYTIEGEVIGKYELGNDKYVSTVLPTHLGTGMYVIQITIGDFVKSQKLIAE